MRKILLCLAALVVVAGGSAVAWLMLAYPTVPPAPDLRVDANRETIERGRYLVQNVAACTSCHGQRDESRYAEPLLPGTDGMGGWQITHGMPGTVVVPNITPAALGGWTDGQLLKAFTAGVTPDGRCLFPFMPYLNYGHLSQVDASAIVTYLRTMKPMPQTLPRTRLKFPMNLIVRTIPRPAAFVPTPDAKKSVEVGAYLVNVAGCMGCHTPMVHGKPQPGLEFAGGHEFGARHFKSANITPDMNTGIGKWDRARFLQRFRHLQTTTVGPDAMNTVMPWASFAGMSDSDLNAIYDYLRTVKPVHNAVQFQ